jgi:hypothetical protein
MPSSPVLLVCQKYFLNLWLIYVDVLLPEFSWRGWVKEWETSVRTPGFVAEIPAGGSLL